MLLAKAAPLITPDMERLVRVLKRRSKSGVHWGRGLDFAYMRYCTDTHEATGTTLIFTRDAGHHTSGWLKNPDYERCLHLSISFSEPGNLTTPRHYDKALAETWVRLFFEDRCAMLWEEGPFSTVGKSLSVRHWRLFTDSSWQPIMPRREVYSTQFTELGWKSWSELHAEPLPTAAMRQAQ